jgi:hypothetical protein
MEPNGITLGFALYWALCASRPVASGPSSIDAGDLRRHVEYLASDALAGRETGTSGIATAEEYVAAAFEKAGLTPLPGRETYFVDFTLYRTGFDVEHTSLRLATGEDSRVGIAGHDFRPFPFSDEGALEAQVVFAGYGITAEDKGYDDYAGLDVTGKLVLVFRHAPREKDPEGSFESEADDRHTTFEAKAENARAHGAVGMLLVTDPLNHAPGDDLRLGAGLLLEPPSPNGERKPAADPFLAVHISRDAARMLVSDSGPSLEELQRAVDQGRPPVDLPIGEPRAAIEIRRSEGSEEVPARDVAALLRGSDPGLENEWIVVGGHHDHVGAFGGEGDTVFNGADDNASGVAGVLEMAQAFASLPERPRRSLMFVTFTGEEKGLLGSRALVTQELIPLDNIAFMLNLDMIGRNPQRAVRVYGDGYGRGLRGIIELANEGPGVELEFEGPAYMGNSDHDPFYERDVPFAFLFTGTHEDYHQLGDHASKLDYERMASIVRLAYGVVDRLADAPTSPEFIHNVEWLGLRAEVLPAEGGRVARVTGVEDRSRGESVGFEVGDVLVAFDGLRLDDPEAVGARFRSVEPGTRATVVVARQDGEHQLTVERAKRGFLGIQPGPVDDDRRAGLRLDSGEGVAIVRLTPGGPAARGGLQEGDIVTRIAGRSVGDANLASRLAQVGAGETVEVRAIRGDRRVALRVTLGEASGRP